MTSTQPRSRWRLLVAMLLGVAMFAAAGGSDDADEAAPAEEEAPADEPAPAEEEAPADEPEEEAPAEGGIDPDRCAANEAAGTIVYISGFDFAAAAGILDVVVAEAEGFFDEVCLDVELQGNVAPQNATLVAGGAGQFGSAGSFAELVNLNVQGGSDLVAVGQWGHTAIEGLVVPADGPVQALSDLPGNTMGIKFDIPFSIQALLAQEGIERGSFEELLLDGFDPVAHLDLGIDALPVFKSNEPGQLDAAGVEFIMFDPLDFDVPSSFGVTFTTQSFLDDNPTVVEDFVRATIKGFEFAVANPDEAVADAFELIDAAGNPFFLAQEAEAFRWSVESAIVLDNLPGGVNLGALNPDRLGEEIDLLTSVGVFESTPDWQSMIVTDVADASYTDDGTLAWPG